MSEGTKEGNKLIAEFMGAEMPSYSVQPDGSIKKCSLVYNGHRVDYIYVMDKWSEYGDLFKFHSSWDWLMPVVEKVNNICKEIGGPLSNHSKDQEHLPDKHNNPQHWKSWIHHSVTLTTDRQLVWQACVDFIQWYN